MLSRERQEYYFKRGRSFTENHILSWLKPNARLSHSANNNEPKKGPQQQKQQKQQKQQQQQQQPGRDEGSPYSKSNCLAMSLGFGFHIRYRESQQDYPNSVYPETKAFHTEYERLRGIALAQGGSVEHWVAANQLVYAEMNAGARIATHVHNNEYVNGFASDVKKAVYDLFRMRLDCGPPDSFRRLFCSQLRGACEHSTMTFSPEGRPMLFERRAGWGCDCLGNEDDKEPPLLFACLTNARADGGAQSTLAVAPPLDPTQLGLAWFQPVWVIYYYLARNMFPHFAIEVRRGDGTGDPHWVRYDGFEGILCERRVLPSFHVVAGANGSLRQQEKTANEQLGQVSCVVFERCENPSSSSSSSSRPTVAAGLGGRRSRRLRIIPQEAAEDEPEEGGSPPPPPPASEDAMDGDYMQEAEEDDTDEEAEEGDEDDN
jgi:hypothetical protein